MGSRDVANPEHNIRGDEMIYDKDQKIKKRGGGASSIKKSI